MLRLMVFSFLVFFLSPHAFSSCNVHVEPENDVIRVEPNGTIRRD